MGIRNLLVGAVIFLIPFSFLLGQSSNVGKVFVVTVTNNQNELLEGANVELLRPDQTIPDGSILTNKNGQSIFKSSVVIGSKIKAGFVGFEPITIQLTKEILSSGKYLFILQPKVNTLANVNVSSRKPFIQQAKGKTIVNVEASVTNAGTTILEVLEKSPGVMVDKNGGISLQGKPGVLVLIDDKQTFLSGADLNNLLGSMSSNQVEQIELITSPSAKYDASGNAGIINIKTKKNKQIGFNGVFNTSYGQGRYPKSNNSLNLNYRNGKINGFLNWSSNYNESYLDLYALRHYYSPSGNLLATFDQPTMMVMKNLGNTLKAGIDYYVSTKTTIGFVLTGIVTNRDNNSDASANWKNPSGTTDSSIRTFGITENHLNSGGINFNGKHSISKQQDLSFDVDVLAYTINNKQSFSNQLQQSGGYNEASRGSLPATIDIFTAKADHSLQTGKTGKLESGYKVSRIHTDNTADYEKYDGTQWKPDLNKSNHFIYTENIQALYSSLEQKIGKLSFQAGLRYEFTQYDGHQLGNSLQKDSAFSRNYSGFFPSGYLSYEVDSANSFTFTAGRRIDRPPFQKLNPYVVFINKYTFERGNPFLLPQFSWNVELTHQYKQLLTTTLSYSIIKDYFSQIFLNEGNDILVYTHGNVGKMYNLGISMAIQTPITKWWALTGQILYNHKELKGYQNINYQSDISQWNFSMNNQFKLGKDYTAEISGFYTSKARNDLQELLYPTGQLSAGISKPILKKKGTLRLSIRDIFHTQVMEGFTDFPGADEYFIIRRDSRVCNLSFTYRFGKPLKTAKRNTGGAKDEIDRVGSGG